MNSYLQNSLTERNWRSKLASVGTSALVHALIIGLLLVIAGPVWKQTSKRTVVTLTAPVPPVKRVAKVSLKARSRPRVTASLSSPALQLAVVRKSLALPAAVSRPKLKIEAPVEMAPVQVTPMPAMTMPTLVVKPVVNVGMLDAPGAPVASNHLSAGVSGFDSTGGQEKAGGGRRVAGSGFDETSTSGPAKTKRLSTTAFDVAEAPVTAAKKTPASFEGIEILEKPRPVYTEEARRLRIEGTVRLRVVFSAAGQIRVVSVVQGLGHGLDEAAKQAAEAIRFRPARRDGRPVDAPAVIQIQFQIA